MKPEPLKGKIIELPVVGVDAIRSAVEWLKYSIKNLTFEVEHPILMNTIDEAFEDVIEK